METIVGLALGSALDTLLVFIVSIVLWAIVRNDVWTKYYQEGFDEATKHWKKEINRLKKNIGEE